MLTQERHMCKHTPLQRQAQMWAFMTLLSDDGEVALQDRLVGPTEKLNDMPLGSAMELSGRVYHAGDLVFSGDGMLGKCTAFLQKRGELYVIVQLFELKTQLSAFSSRWQLKDEQAVWLATSASLRLAFAWYREGDALIVILQ